MISVLGEAEGGREGLVAARVAQSGVLVEDGHWERLEELLEEVGALFGDPLGRSQLGDVGMGADHAQRAPLGVDLDQLAAREDAAVVAALRAQAHLDRVALAFFSPALDGALHGAAVIGVDELLKGGVALRELIRFVAEHRVVAGAVNLPAALDVPVQEAVVGRFQGEREALFALGERPLGLFALA